MKLRLCDYCGQEILSKQIFYKIMEQSWEGENKNRIIQKHIADVCIRCYKEKLK